MSFFCDDQASQVRSAVTPPRVGRAGKRWTMAAYKAAAVRYSWGLRGVIHEPRPDWRERARCRGLAPSFFMGNNTPRALQLCIGCPARLDCLAAALREEANQDRDLMYGVRGGLTAAERHQVLADERRLAMS